MTIRLALRYDMRSPAIGAPAAQLYPAAVEQAALADAAGFDVVYLAEHHGAEDGYCPAPLHLASAMAARTSRLRLHFSALVAVLHHPVLLAEELAVLDNLSRGRVEMTLGIGYRQYEYDIFGVQKSKRVRLLDEIIDVFERAWSGEPFDFRGQQIVVRPVPVQKDGPTIFIGGSTEASALRAARTRHGFLPATPDLLAVFAAERTRLGGTVPPPPRAKGPLFLFVSENPDRDWDIVAPHVMYHSNMNALWAQERAVGATPYPPLTDVAALKADPKFRVVTPQDCVELIEKAGADAEITLHPMMGGLAPEHGSRSLGLFIDRVLPSLEAKGLWSRPAPGGEALR